MNNFAQIFHATHADFQPLDHDSANLQYALLGRRGFSFIFGKRSQRIWNNSSIFIGQSHKVSIVFFSTISNTRTSIWRCTFSDCVHCSHSSTFSCTATMGNSLRKVLRTYLIVYGKLIGTNCPLSYRTISSLWSRMHSNRFTIEDLAWSLWIWKHFAR